MVKTRSGKSSSAQPLDDNIYLKNINANFERLMSPGYYRPDIVGDLMGCSYVPKKSKTPKKEVDLGFIGCRGSADYIFTSLVNDIRHFNIITKPDLERVVQYRDSLNVFARNDGAFQCDLSNVNNNTVMYIGLFRTTPDDLKPYYGYNSFIPVHTFIIVKFNDRFKIFQSWDDGTVKKSINELTTPGWMDNNPADILAELLVRKNRRAWVDLFGEETFMRSSIGGLYNGLTDTFTTEFIVKCIIGDLHSSWFMSRL